jgi:hypothetical protein
MISKTFFTTLGNPGKLGKESPPRRLRAHNPNLRRLRGASHQIPPQVAQNDGFLSRKIANFFRPTAPKSFPGNPPREQRERATTARNSKYLVARRRVPLPQINCTN